MRVSINKNDSGFVRDAYNYKVIFNGEEIFNCTTADEELGEVHCYVKDPNGYYFSHNKIEILKGKVEIIKPKKDK